MRRSRPLVDALRHRDPTDEFISFENSKGRGSSHELPRNGGLPCALDTVQEDRIPASSVTHGRSVVHEGTIGTGRDITARWRRKQGGTRRWWTKLSDSGAANDPRLLSGQCTVRDHDLQVHGGPTVPTGAQIHELLHLPM